MITLLKNRWMAVVWIVLNVSGATVLAWKMFGSRDKRVFLPGETSHGHYQIEMSCAECHTPMKGLREDACIRCHGAELKMAQDSHPRSKFDDPTNGHLTRYIKADECIACHVEHKPDMTHPMGVTVPENYCFYCHQDVGENRPSHAGLSYDSCSTVGCHNFHDNRALYERFLRKHMDDPPLLSDLGRPPLGLPRSMGPSLTRGESDAPTEYAANEELVTLWENDVHAQQGVNCRACHEGSSDTGVELSWTDHPTWESCGSCHDKQVSGWKAGRHGMRVAAGLTPMTPGEARQPMRLDVAHVELSCTSCHGAHAFDTGYAAMEACLTCHQDAHSVAYEGSIHAALWRAEQSGQGPAGSGVSCATCHMPVMEDDEGNTYVQHNQNDNLRPSEKMIRSVCMDCHGVEFALQALADTDLVAAGFTGKPSGELETMDWVRKRAREIEERRQQAEVRRKAQKDNEINEDDL